MLVQADSKSLPEAVVTQRGIVAGILWGRVVTPQMIPPGTAHLRGGEGVSLCFLWESENCFSCLTLAIQNCFLSEYGSEFSKEFCSSLLCAR